MTLKDLEIQKNLIEMNLALAEKMMKEGKIELAAYRMNDARKSLEDLFKDIKKPTDTGMSIGE